MADNRKIVHGVRMATKVITDPDELEEVLTPEMRDRLLKSGAITGDWKAKGKAEDPKKEDGKKEK